MAHRGRRVTAFAALLSLGALTGAAFAQVAPATTMPHLVYATTSMSDLVYMQIVAHQDDDFLFMNPDLGNQITAGLGTVTVFMTAGQTVGSVNPDRPMTREGFAAARQRGIKAAYAQMAGVANVWTRSLASPDGVHVVESYQLNAAPRIKLIFMNLPDGGDDLFPHTNALEHLFSDPGFQTNTIVPACVVEPFFIPCVPQAPLQFYDRGGVVAVLVALLQDYQPVVVRTLDPQPFKKLRPGTSDQYEVRWDNLDHTAAARFANEALASYSGPHGSRRSSVVHYKGYSFLDYPKNLGPADYVEKRTTAETYRPHDPNYELFSSSYDPFYRVMYERYPDSTTWVERADDGRLVAVDVQDERVVMWFENAPGGSWSGPIRLGGGGPIAPHLTLLKRPDGLLQVFALRLPLAREASYPALNAPLQQVITAVQIPGGLEFGSWQTLGSPDAGSCAEMHQCQWAGVPTAAIDGAGRTYVFAKSSRGIVSYKYFSPGTGAWSSWATFTGPQDIIDGIAAITRDDGRIEVFATARSGWIQRYLQSGTLMLPASSLVANAASAPTVTKNQDGRLEIFFREAGTGRVLTYYKLFDGTWAGPVVLYGDAGVGPVAAIRRGGTGHIMLFERNVWGGISATHQIAPNDIFQLQWQILGGFLNEYPAAATDHFGRAVLLVKGADAKLYMRREVSADAVGVFDGWRAVGY